MRWERSCINYPLHEFSQAEQIYDTHYENLKAVLDKYDKGYNVVLGNRKHPDSVLVKQEARWGIGITLFRHIQRIDGQAIFSRGISDTQAAFKLYEKSVLEKILENPSVYDFSFDTDWILSILSNETPFEQVPFAFIDSFAESASVVQGPMTTWETLLKGLLKAVRDRNIPYDEEIGKVLDEEIQSYRDLELLINDLPPELEKVENKDIGNPEIMSPGIIRKWIKHCKEKNK